MREKKREGAVRSGPDGKNQKKEAGRKEPIGRLERRDDREWAGREAGGRKDSDAQNKGIQYWRPSNMLYPLPAVLVSCMDEQGRANVMTAAWAGTVCSDPVMVSVSIRPQRYSHDIIERTGEFVLAVTTEEMVRAVDYAGVRSGRDEDKFERLHLKKTKSLHVKAPGIAQSPVNLECHVEQILHLGSHDMFIARVLSTDIDPQYLDEKGKFALEKAHLLAYSHGEYYGLGRYLGKFGFSVQGRSPEGRDKAPAKAGKNAGSRYFPKGKGEDSGYGNVRRGSKSPGRG